MVIRFRKEFALPSEQVFAYFKSPADWVGLFGFAGAPRDRGNGWWAVPLKRFPFPLVARNTQLEENRLARWEFRGFWRGTGEVRLTDTATGVLIEGFEQISVRWLGILSVLAEKLILERGFRGVWEFGWHRLRKIEQRAS